jgi:CelD/BcsL family acetyltransferase involved in cellulose biosynthesis
LSAEGRDTLRRALQAAECRGQLATEIHTPDLNDLAELLDAALAVAGHGRELNQDVFLRQYAEAACIDGMLRIALLRIGDRVAAAQIGVESAAAFWLLTEGEASCFGDCAPGRLLLRETIRYAAEAALSSFEFLGNTAAVSKDWTTSERACVSLRAYPLNPRGLAALVADIAVAGWQHYKRR